jgi:hypothetical protein
MLLKAAGENVLHSQYANKGGKEDEKNHQKVIDDWSRLFHKLVFCIPCIS